MKTKTRKMNTTNKQETEPTMRTTKTKTTTGTTTKTTTKTN